MELERLGVFGGTFNPIHIGHLIVAEDVRERFSLDMILFVPAFIPPHKSVGVAPADKRLEMVRLSIKDNPLFSVSDIELKRKEKSYTVDTLAELREKVSSSLFFLIGSEAFLQIHTWRKPNRLFELSNFIVMERPERIVGVTEFENYLKELETKLPSFVLKSMDFLNETYIFEVEANGKESFIYLTPVVNIGVSATMIRKRVKSGRSIKYLVTKEVERYIEENGLYKGD